MTRLEERAEGTNQNLQEWERHSKEQLTLLKTNTEVLQNSHKSTEDKIDEQKKLADESLAKLKQKKKNLKGRISQNEVQQSATQEKFDSDNMSLQKKIEMVEEKIEQ